MEFKDELKGERLVLKRTFPNIELAKVIFKNIDESREHLKPWFEWVEYTQVAEDTLKYLFDKEKDFEEEKKIEYGIYVNEEYIGNIAIFDLNARNKSGEIGYWISLKHIRKGYTSEAVKILEKEFFEEQELNRIVIKMNERNVASEGVAKKNNYFFEGKERQDKYNSYFGDFENTLIYSKLREEYKK